jgi:hypothetical protein
MPLDVYEALAQAGIVPEKAVSMFLQGVTPPFTEHEMTHCSGDLSTGVKVISSQEELEKVNNNLTYLFNHNHHQGDKENE